MTIGAHDGAEVYELVGIFLLNKVKNMTKIASVYIVTTGCQYLKTKAALNLKKKKELTKNIQGLRFRNSGRI